MNLTKFDTEELACKVVGLDYDEIDADTSIIEDKLIDDLNIDLEEFTTIVNQLIPLIDVGESPMTKKKYKGFSNQEGVWYCKVEV